MKKIWSLGALCPVLALPALSIVSCGASAELRTYNATILSRIDKLGEIDNEVISKPGANNQPSIVRPAAETTDQVIAKIQSTLEAFNTNNQNKISISNIRVFRKIANDDNEVRTTFTLTDQNKNPAEQLFADHVVRIKPAKPTRAVGTEEGSKALTSGQIEAASLDSALSNKTVTEAQATFNNDWVVQNIGSLLAGSYKINSTSDLEAVSFTPDEANKSGVLKFTIKANNYYIPKLVIADVRPEENLFRGDLVTDKNQEFGITITKFK